MAHCSLVRSLFALSACALFLAASGSARAQTFPSDQVTLLEFLPLNGFPSNPSSANDCWGYVSPSGREYALLGVRDAVVVVELSDPSGPVIVASIPHQSSNWCDIRTYGSYAYAVNETGGGIDVIDLGQVDEGVVTLVQQVIDFGLGTCHNIAVDEVSGYLYLASPNINQGRLVAMNLSDPADPFLENALPPPQGGVSHDVQVVTYTSGPYTGMQIAFSSSGTDGLEIFDVTDKGSMFKISDGTYPNQTYTHQGWLSEDRKYFYINDELDSVNETVIFDVQDIFNPLFVGTYTAGVTATDHNVFVHQGRIFEGEYRAGLRVFDASDPLNPVQVGWIDTFPGDDSPGSGGVWGVYPFLPSGKVILSDKTRGMFVVWPGPAPLQFDIAAGAAPQQVSPNEESFEVSITADPGHVLDPSSPSLVYDLGDGPVEVPMLPMGGDFYRASFGALPCGALVQYHLRAATTAGIAIRSPVGAPQDTYLAVAADQALRVLEDDLAVADGWIAGLPGDTAVGGQWLLADPIATDAQPEVDHTPDPVDTCFVTGQGAMFGNIGDADVDGGQTTLVSPALDLSASGQATIGYWRWYHNSFSQSDADEGNGPNQDVLRVQISDDNGETWVPVETVGPGGSESGGNWFLHSFDVGSLVELTTTVRLRFIVSDFGSLSIVEAAIDDLLVFSIDCAPPKVRTNVKQGGVAPPLQ